jgi:hypothetical protein
MHIALGLRRKRDEIAATIAVYEARIDAARRDFSVLDQAARLFDVETQRTETVIPEDLDRLAKPEGLLEAPFEVTEQRTLATDQLTPPVVRMQDLEPQFTNSVTRASTRGGPERIPVEFFYLDWP